jgi:hypothetical protein
MRSPLMSRLSLCTGVAFAAGLAHAQTQSVFVELEPNGRKSEALNVVCMSSGDALTGVTTGGSTTANDTSPTSADVFRVHTCAQPVAIYRHRLTITTAGIAGHVGELLGLEVMDVPPPTITNYDTVLQASSLLTVPQQFNQWYGFGRGEEIYFRIRGTPATVAPYVVTLTTSTVTPIVVPNLLHAGVITITTEGQGHTTDTELHVYDASFHPISGYKNDDTPTWMPGGGVGFQSTLQRTFDPGTYYVLVAHYNLSDHELTGSDDEYQFGGVLDFDDAILASDSTPGWNVSFAITDNTSTIALPALLPPAAYEVLWYEIHVGPSSGVISTYCFGDGTGTVCPCATISAPGNGCPNSVNPAGAHLAGIGQAGVSQDTFTLVGAGMPNNYVLYFQGTTQISVPFGDGLRCAGGAGWRLGEEYNDGGGSQHPSGDPPISLEGSVPPGSTRTYQAWYRNSANYCTVSTFNLTNGVLAIWGP